MQQPAGKRKAGRKEESDEDAVVDLVDSDSSDSDGDFAIEVSDGDALSPVKPPVKPKAKASAPAVKRCAAGICQCSLHLHHLLL